MSVCHLFIPAVWRPQYRSISATEKLMLHLEISKVVDLHQATRLGHRYFIIIAIVRPALISEHFS